MFLNKPIPIFWLKTNSNDNISKVWLEFLCFSFLCKLLGLWITYTLFILKFTSVSTIIVYLLFRFSDYYILLLFQVFLSIDFKALFFYFYLMYSCQDFSSLESCISVLRSTSLLFSDTLQTKQYHTNLENFSFSSIAKTFHSSFLSFQLINNLSLPCLLMR